MNYVVVICIIYDFKCDNYETKINVYAFKLFFIRPVVGAVVAVDVVPVVPKKGKLCCCNLHNI